MVKSRDEIAAAIEADKQTMLRKLFFVLPIIGILALGIATLIPSSSNQLSNPDVTSHFKSSTTSRPHIVFIMADDMGWNSMGYENYDMPFASPFLTTLASKGIRIDNYYSQEVCTPARAALLTGRYPLTIGMQYGVVQTDTAWGLPLNETTIAEVLRDNGYVTHMLGKWHLGHHSPRYLPTARGFDTCTGYVDGDNYYFSKRNPTMSRFRDMITANTECYYAFDGSSLHNYSTHFYRDMAVEIINNHDQTYPLFLYLAFQAVHDPFEDVTHRFIEEDFLEAGIMDQINDNVEGGKRKYYAMTLNVLDMAVSDIVSTLDSQGMLDNTYIIFASDNGGCYLGGGKNGPLRGTKATLFEGGTKVDSFIYSPLISSSLEGFIHPHLMHVSDWFPTILDMVGLTYDPPDGFELDGVSQYSGLFEGNDTAPRNYMLYNSYHNVEGYMFDRWVNGTFAIRNDRYKLIHYYSGNYYSSWFNYSDVLSDDDSYDSGQACETSRSMSGVFTYGLFDLIDDPYETTNLYTYSKYQQLLVELYAVLDQYEANSQTDVGSLKSANKVAQNVWMNAGNFIVPFVSAQKETVDKTYPSWCGFISEQATDDSTSASATSTEPGLDDDFYYTFQNEEDAEYSTNWKKEKDEVDVDGEVEVGEGKDKKDDSSTNETEEKTKKEKNKDKSKKDKSDDDDDDDDDDDNTHNKKHRFRRSSSSSSSSSTSSSSHHSKHKKKTKL